MKKMLEKIMRRQYGASMMFAGLFGMMLAYNWGASETFSWTVDILFNAGLGLTIFKGCIYDMYPELFGREPNDDEEGF